MEVCVGSSGGGWGDTDKGDGDSESENKAELQHESEHKENVQHSEWICFKQCLKFAFVGTCRIEVDIENETNVRERFFSYMVDSMWQFIVKQTDLYDIQFFASCPYLKP